MRTLKKIIFWIIYGIPAAILFLLRIRVLQITHPDRIGHLCLEPDCFVKEGILGLRPRFRALFLVPRNHAANRTLLDLWAAQLTIISSDFLCFLFAPLARVQWCSYSTAQYAVAINDTAKCVDIYSRWNLRQPVLNYPRDQLSRGYLALTKMGLPKGSWFVCVHSREGGYSPSDEHIHSFRNSDIKNYRLAMEAIVAAGGWCIRVGENSSQPCPSLTGVIDYAHSQYKSDWMDMFLCANCKFFLGNSSGLAMLPPIFGVPCALANMIPGSSSLPVMPGSIGIPKMLRRGASGQAISYPEIMSSTIANFRFAKQYSELGIIVEENTPEEIRDLALEMLEICADQASFSEEDELMQKKYRGLFKPGHFSFGAASRIGSKYLRKHHQLLND